jgi:hypothetical protein
MLGYIAYFLICASSYLQIGFMIQGKTRNLGRLPLFTLVIGLTLLQLSIELYGAPAYIRTGNASSLGGAAMTLALTYRRRVPRVAKDSREPRIVDVHNELPVATVAAPPPPAIPTPDYGCTCSLCALDSAHAEGHS